ncbi:hypothetical protein [Methanolobus halotolerans]|uniref:Uncharacterized protein n=1 Tax=Methanolobus halotolerans TaxID=2052935 RepID=A0A4E0PVF6_9EURY|nr:hypothetical protein [Methanolobus halotolerans]TGC09213.1 hypothetical protein CUN85_07560 [Methanolobus halotolerans]
METKKQKKDGKQEDLEIPSLENEIKNWCEAPTEIDDSKSADDLEIDAWCQDSTVNDKDNDKSKKDKN